MAINKGPPRHRRHNTSWEPVSAWYRGWMGRDGGDYHRELAIPAVLELLDLRPGERLLDIGAGHGVLAPAVAAMRAGYTGVDLSESMIRAARLHHGASGRFLVGDARALSCLPALRAGTFDAAVFLLSVQDMDCLSDVLASAAWSLRAGGRLVLLMKHPCFRVPRQSGWGWDARRKLRYRRVDRYLTPLAVPMKQYNGARGGATRTFHYPLADYVNALAAHGLLVDAMRELPTHREEVSEAGEPQGAVPNQDIPLFLGLRARKLGPP